MKEAFISIYKSLFVRQSLFRLHQCLFLVGLWGMGVLNSENDRLSGEESFLKRLAHKSNELVVMDVGANTGRYSDRIKEFATDATIYAFEPHPVNFGRLKAQAAKYGYTALPLGCSDAEGQATLYDYPQGGTTHASMYEGTITELRERETSEWNIELTTIDRFVEREQVGHIDLLKIDTEGNELKVLMGAKQAIENGMIDVIQFEFNEMNVVSRAFLRDFLTLLPQYTFFRMLPDGLIPLDVRHPFLYEIFAYQNVVAIRDDEYLIYQVD